jgi:hypothetical protein
MKAGKRMAHLIMVLAMVPMLSGCFFLLGAAGGAAGGYVASEKGYKVQSPITKEEEKKKESK